MKKTFDLKIAKELLRIRFSQLLINEHCKVGAFKVPVHLALGHEAIAIGIHLMMDKYDHLILSHRNMHYNLARTGSLKAIIDEFLLKKEGLAQGELGSMNLADESKGIIYTSSILGNNLSVAAGCALAKKIRNEKGIVTVVAGDGAIEEGSFYESLLFLKSNSLSCMVIIENNEWSLATKINERRCPIDIKKITEALGLKYKFLDSNDVYEYSDVLKTFKKESLSTATTVCVQVNLTTFGGWYVDTDVFPFKRFINYHAGAAHKVHIDNGPLIEESEKDPIFVLQNKVPENEMKSWSTEVLNELTKELL